MEFIKAAEQNGIISIGEHCSIFFMCADIDFSEHIDYNYLEIK